MEPNSLADSMRDIDDGPPQTYTPAPPGVNDLYTQHLRWSLDTCLEAENQRPRRVDGSQIDTPQIPCLLQSQIPARRAQLSRRVLQNWICRFLSGWTHKGLVALAVPAIRRSSRHER